MKQYLTVSMLFLSGLAYAASSSEGGSRGVSRNTPTESEIVAELKNKGISDDDIQKVRSLIASRLKSGATTENHNKKSSMLIPAVGVASISILLTILLMYYLFVRPNKNMIASIALFINDEVGDDGNVNFLDFTNEMRKKTSADRTAEFNNHDTGSHVSNVFNFCEKYIVGKRFEKIDGGAITNTTGVMPELRVKAAP